MELAGRNSTLEGYRKKINIVPDYIQNHLDENIDLAMLAELSHLSSNRDSPLLLYYHFVFNLNLFIWLAYL